MSYDAQEKSVYAGRPVEMYQFVQGFAKWFYTSADTQVQYNGDVYQPIPIQRTAVDQSQEVQAGSIDVTLPRDNPLASKFIAYNPAAPIWLTVTRLHLTDSNQERAVQFVGRIINATFDGSEAKLKCAPIQEILQRKCPRCLYQSVCNHVLYSTYCQRNSGDYRMRIYVETVAGNQITTSAIITKPNGWFTHGYAVRNGEEYRMIINHQSNVLSLLSPFAGLSPGEYIEIYPGCDRTEATCASKFNNRVNFLGWMYIPTKNPFDAGIA